jgi:hypothetical protein
VAIPIIGDFTTVHELDFQKPIAIIDGPEHPADFVFRPNRTKLLDFAKGDGRGLVT